MLLLARVPQHAAPPTTQSGDQTQLHAAHHGARAHATTAVDTARQPRADARRALHPLSDPRRKHRTDFLQPRMKKLLGVHDVVVCSTDLAADAPKPVVADLQVGDTDDVVVDRKSTRLN